MLNPESCSQMLFYQNRKQTYLSPDHFKLQQILLVNSFKLIKSLYDLVMGQIGTWEQGVLFCFLISVGFQDDFEMFIYFQAENSIGLTFMYIIKPSSSATPPPPHMQKAKERMTGITNSVLKDFCLFNMAYNSQRNLCLVPQYQQHNKFKIADKESSVSCTLTH